MKFKLVRMPVLKPVEAKKVTLYQAPAPMMKRVPVYSTLMRGNDVDILDEIFFLGNNDDKMDAFLHHSVSVGDIIEVDDVMYECAIKGWKKI